MCSQQQVDSVDDWKCQHHRLMACTTWLCVIYRHKVLIALQIFNEPIWGLVENDNFYLTLLLHEVLRADLKITMVGTELLHMIFQMFCVTHICCIGHDTHAQSTSIYWHVLCPYCDTINPCSCVGSDFFKTPLLN